MQRPRINSTFNETDDKTAFGYRPRDALLMPEPLINRNNNGSSAFHLCATAPTVLELEYMMITKRWRHLFPRFGHNKLIKEILMNKDQIKGQVEEVKGKVEEAAGVILDDENMQIKGNIKKNVGKAQSILGDLKDAINNDD
jgi:uncharacterized protein YjbJ (UPF0337 family)